MKAAEKGKNDKNKSGFIEINVDFRAVITVIATIALFLFLPIYMLGDGSKQVLALLGYEDPNPYSAQAIAERDGNPEVLGVNQEGENTSDVESSVNIEEYRIPLINITIQEPEITQENIPLLIAGVSFVTIAFFLLLYLLLGRFET